MNVVEMMTGNLKCLKWSSDVLLDLGSLARDAGLSPEAHLFVDVVPHKLAGHELPRGMHQGVG